VPVLKSKWQLVVKTSTGLPDYSKLVLKHVEDTPLTFIYNYTVHCLVK